MKGYLVKSILGLTLTTVVVGGTIYGVHKYNDSKSVATGIEATEEFALNDVRNEEALTDADELELLTLQKAEEDAEVTDEAEVVEETEETTKEDAEVTETEEDTDKEEDKKPTTEKKEEVKAEETTSETAQTTSEEPQANIVEEPQAVATEETATTQTTTTETVAETPTEQPTGDANRSEWKPLFAPIENPSNDSERMYNEMVSSTSMEEFMQRQEALNNASFDGDGNLVDPSMITTEEPTDTVTEVIVEE